jgi:hypothetical protein
MKLCLQCSQPFKPDRNNPKQVYCSPYCKGRAFRLAHTQMPREFRFHPVLTQWLYKA